jgi:hypothetical protein
MSDRHRAYERRKLGVVKKTGIGYERLYLLGASVVLIGKGDP